MQWPRESSHGALFLIMWSTARVALQEEEEKQGEWGGGLTECRQGELPKSAGLSSKAPKVTKEKEQKERE